MYAGMFSRSGAKDGSRLSGCSSRASSASMPPTAKTECEILQSANVKIFSFSDLRIATRNFRPDSVLGEGGFGSVYKGWIDENTLSACKPGTGIAVAVKRLNQESLQGHREWLVSMTAILCCVAFKSMLVLSIPLDTAFVNHILVFFILLKGYLDIFEL